MQAEAALKTPDEDATPAAGTSAAAPPAAAADGEGARDSLSVEGSVDLIGQFKATVPL